VETENLNEEFEKCVMCDKVTSEHKNTHIDHRHFYVEGCGQLCKDCYSTIYSINQ